MLEARIVGDAFFFCVCVLIDILTHRGSDLREDLIFTEVKCVLTWYSLGICS